MPGRRAFKAVVRLAYQVWIAATRSSSDAHGCQVQQQMGLAEADDQSGAVRGVGNSCNWGAFS
jgi:hypothetical protein